MVMKKMREYTRGVLWVVIVAFVGTIVFAWGLGGFESGRDPNIVGEIGGVEISRMYYESLYRQEYDAALQESPDGEISDERARQIHNQVWNRISTEILFSQQVEELNVKVTNKELVEFMTKSPPPEIQANEAFQTNGQFDYNKYLSMMANPEANWLPIENYVRNQLSLAKLQKLALSPIYVNEDEIRYEFLKNNEEVSVDYVFFRPSRTPKESDEPDEVLKEFYNNNKDMFLYLQEPPKVVLTTAVFFPYVQPSVEDSIINLLNTARERYLAGEDFSELANEYTQDSPGGGGDLPWNRGEGFVPEFTEQLLAIEKGEVTRPFRSRFGYHIALLEDTREKEDEDGVYTELKAKHILIRVPASEEASTEYEYRIKELKEAGSVGEFRDMASDLGARISETEPLAANDRLTEAGQSSQEVLSWAHQADVGDVSDLYEIRSGHLMVCVTRKIKERMPEFEEIKKMVGMKYETEKDLERKYEKAQEFAREAKANPDQFNNLAARYDVEVRTQEDFNRSEFLGGGVMDQAIFKAIAFNLTEDEPVSKAVKTQGGVYVLKLADKTSVNEEMYEAQHDSIYQDLYAAKQEKLWNDWYRKLVEEANIKDYRDLDEG